MGMEAPPLLLLGVGQVAQAAAVACRGTRRVIGTTRQPEHLFDLFHEEIEPVVMPWPSADVIAPLAKGADVLVSFPPDGSTDAILAPACLEARALVYISSTAVYGNREGTIGDTTPAEQTDDKAMPRLEAEKIWRSIGANVLRAPGIYGPKLGLHKRLSDGTFRLPGDGSGVSSRIHVDDLVAFILASFSSGKQGETYVVGDIKPASHYAVAEFLCREMGLPMPPSADINEVHHTLRYNRNVDASRALRELHVNLKYPTYKEGYSACLAKAAAD
jgi:uncharacterized protein YbjT (DUF2867 family)